MTAEPMSQPDPLPDSSVNSRLTPQPHPCRASCCRPKRAKRTKENPEYMQGLNAMIRQLEIRVGTQGDLEGLTDVVALHEVVDQVTSAIVDRLREHGFPWSEVGRVLGISKQAAQQKYGRSQ